MRFSTDTELRDVVRAVLKSSTVSSLWPALAELGLFAAAVPASDGGLGLTEADLVPVLVELGYAAAPVPAAETMLVAPLLAEPQRSQAMAGRLRIAVAGPTGLVPFGGAADAIWTGTALVPASGSVLSTVDVSLAVTRCSPGPVADRFTLAAAAQLIGLGRRMLDLTTAYVGARRQFGVPVGSFQAVKHRLADALLRLEFAEPAVLAAGWSLAGRDGSLASRDVSLAALLAAEAAQEVAKAAIQGHGAIGYTVEYDLHRYAKRAWALVAGIDVDVHLARVASWLGMGGSDD